MWNLVQHAVLPTMLLGLGIASLTYGVSRHRATVLESEEIEITLAPPDMPEPPPDFGGPPGFGPPRFMPPRLPPELRKVTQIVMVGKEATEMAMIRDVTIGGLALTDEGELKRTYTGKPPSLCPT